MIQYNTKCMTNFLQIKKWDVFSTPHFRLV